MILLGKKEPSLPPPIKNMKKIKKTKKGILHVNKFFHSDTKSKPNLSRVMSESAARMDMVRAMALGNQNTFLEYAKECSATSQMWRSIYQTWIFRYASDRDLVPRDVDEMMVDRMIQQNFSEHILKNEEVKSIAKDLSIDLKLKV